MQVEQTKLPGVLILTPQRFKDDRGFFSEVWNKKTLLEAGLDLPDFVQDNHSLSSQKGTLRGMHYQAPPHAQGKLARCGRGRLFDVAVDVRHGSETRGQWVGVELSFENGKQIWIPPGFLHGFVTREDNTEICYKCTDYFNKASDGAVRWDTLGIDWDEDNPIISEKDGIAPDADRWRSPFEVGS